MNKKVLFTLLAFTIIAGSAILWSETRPQAADASQTASSQPPLEVEVATVTASTVNFTRELPGRTSAYKVAEIRPQVSGIVTKRFFEEGSDVKLGQQLYQIDPAPYQAAYDSAKADLQKAEANVRAINAKSGRYAELVKIGGISKQDYDDVKANLQQTQADVAIAKAALATAKINLDYTKVFSPISGRIGKSQITEGALVTANQATALATVQQLDPIYVDVTQSSADLMKLRREFSGTENLKTPVKLFVEGDSEAYSQDGELQFSDVTVDQSTGSVQLRILFPNAEGQLLPGMFVRARIDQAQAENALIVPQRAVIRNADNSVTVWVVGDDGKVKSQPIQVGQAVGDSWLVTSGLKGGEKVVTAGIQKLKPDIVVKPIETTKEQNATTSGEASPSTETE